MTSSFKITLAQINPHVGNLSYNVDLHLQAYEEACAQDSDLIVFPELSLIGYPPEDLILKPSFHEAVSHSLSQIIAATKGKKAALILGAPFLDQQDQSKIYNSAFVIQNGQILERFDKHFLPNYGVFDEYRYFEKGALKPPISIHGIKCGVLVCEDLWYPDVAQHFKERGAELLIALNASPYETRKFDRRLEQSKARVSETNLSLVYVNQVGGQDELVFDGQSFILDGKSHNICTRLKAFETQLRTVSFPFSQQTAPHQSLDPVQEIYSALVCGLRDYVGKNKFPGVVIGLSGGVDSALTAAIAVDALGAAKVHCVMMPSVYTSCESLDDAADCAKKLSVPYDIYPIKSVVQDYETLFTHDSKGEVSSIVMENIQARVRGALLMGISNQTGNMVLTTGNKSEVSVGYMTLYGDMCGGFSVLKDVYKTMVYDLCAWRNTHVLKNGQGPVGEAIPQNIISKAPTAELKPGQKDQDSLPPYEILDQILYGLIELEQSQDDLIKQGFEKETVAKVQKLIYTAEYKRRQAAPGVKISIRNFGRDRRYPITNGFR